MLFWRRTVAEASVTSLRVLHVVGDPYFSALCGVTEGKGLFTEVPRRGILGSLRRGRGVCYSRQSIDVGAQEQAGKEDAEDQGPYRKNSDDQMAAIALGGTVRHKPLPDPSGRRKASRDGPRECTRQAARNECRPSCGRHS
jgi:hypothetical protein